MNDLIRVLMTRDGMTEEEAYRAVSIASEKIWEGEDPEDILEYEFGLEPDYVYDLIEGGC